VALARRTRQLGSAVRWLGGLSGERLVGNVVVLSPHLDDGVFSLGAAIAAAEPGSDVAVVTVLAGDPGSDEPAGDWDARAGFETAGESARARRAEDELACRDVGARPVWLPFRDHQYDRGGSDDQVWAAVEEAIGGAETVLVPGFPLIHEDHAWLARLVDAHGLPGRRVGRYVEQPYAAAWTVEPQENGWTVLKAGGMHRLSKARAYRRYESQLPLLERKKRIRFRLERYEAARGGEWARWT